MNAYEISILKSVKHNGEFSHNLLRMELIHARNENEARNKVFLLPCETNNITGIIVDVSEEVIYSIRKIGTVHIEKFYVYSDGRNPIPVK